jgi:hypothetical protein
MVAIAHPRAWMQRRRARRDADYWIGHGFESRYPWRVAELTCGRERGSCARSVRGVIGELDGSMLPGATPIRRAALRRHISLLEALETRLAGDTEVSAAGMLAVNELLTSPGSCLFVEGGDDRAALLGVLDRLEVQH